MSRLRTDRHLILAELEGGPLTTGELADRLRIHPERIARSVHGLAMENCLERHIRGGSFKITPIGAATLDRILEAEDGIRRPKRTDPTEGVSIGGSRP
jgi:predicted transcriptional regulator